MLNRELMFTLRCKRGDRFAALAGRFRSWLWAEVGADAIKMAYTGSAETFREVTQACYCPVLIQGGARKGCDAKVLSTVQDAVRAGGAGAAVGRNLWQHADPAGFTAVLGAAIHDVTLIGEALGIPRYVRPAKGGDRDDRSG